MAKTKVKYSLGRTLNMGDFESTRIDVGAEMFCDEDEVGATYVRLKTWVDQKIQEEENEWKT